MKSVWVLGLSFALAVLVAACAAPVSRRPSAEGCRVFKASADFTQAERAALERAVDRWNDVAITPFCLVDAADGESAARTDNGIYRIQHGSEAWVRLSETFKGFLGMYFSSTGQIGIVDGLDPAVFEVVALHELGHAHGLAHTEAPAIMHASIGRASDFTSIDMAECRRVGAC